MIPPETLLTPENLALLKTLPDQGDSLQVLKWFLWLCQIPHPSGTLAEIQKALLDMAKTLGCTAEMDKPGNVVIRKPGTSDKADHPALCIQSHLDMVASADPGTTHDFEKRPIVPRLVMEQEKPFLRATNTTLGADDGIGMAAALAILEGPQVTSHPPIEALFTAEEESDMSGAEHIAPAPFLTAQRLINVDSEEEYAICVGCAGGFEDKFHLQGLVRDETVSTKTVYQVTIAGLSGGHSGAQIHEGHANALQVLSRILSQGVSRQGIPSTDLLIASYKGGTAVNTIPRTAMAELVIQGDPDVVIKGLERAFQVVQRECKTVDPNMTLKIKKKELETASSPLNASSSLRMLDFLNVLPHGVLRQSPDVPGLVESSVCLSFASLSATDSFLFAHLFCRSSSDSQMQYWHDSFKGLVSLCGGICAEEWVAPFPGWQPNLSSPLLQLVKKAHSQVMKREARVYAIHAGLECGFLQGKYPTMDCVSIGPTVLDAHTPNERLDLESVPRFWALLKTCCEMC